MSNEYNLSDFINQILKWKKELIYASIIIVVLSIVISILLPNYYQADTTFYAASPDLAKPIPIGGDEKDVRIYGDDKDLDRLFTIASSHEVLFFLVDSFDLYKHYGIDNEDAKAKFKVREKLTNNYKTIKTKYGALLLIVEDKDPKMSADIANAARNKIESISQQIVKSSQKKLIENYDANIFKKQIQSDSLANRLKRVKQSAGVFETWGQTSLYNKILTDAESDYEDAKGKIIFYKKYPSFRDSVIKYMAQEMGALNKKNKAISELEKYAPVLSELKQLEQELSRLHDQISLDKERLKQLNATYYAPFSALHLIEAAEMPVQKSRPKRSIIVLLSSLIGIMFCILSIFVIDNIKNSERRTS
jgi:tyrosine-protein kinase Etk/Wzc